ncbi:zinc carboxypeptidase [Echria macrotheca]|uniref:Zinc carboxypeptidase n=1 Tax=Echria macrotheca TaxID=438768 RepID=A0AAJ0FE59_9PEZI|nr:zinc carboxypeptidase [Echria macrotheca]
MELTILLVSLLLSVQTVSPCLLESERHGGHIQRQRSAPYVRRQSSNDTLPPIPVARGDRFQGGKLIPQGLGLQAEGAKIESILNLDEIHSGMAGLAREFNIELIEAPVKTYENRTIVGARAAGKDGKVRAMIEANIHARERGGPDHVLYFLADLLSAGRTGRGVTFGGVSYTHAQVRTVLDLGLLVLPTVNPDGLAYDLATDKCWRKNRNPKSANATKPDSIGVDLNRNFDFLWDFEKEFAPHTHPASAQPGALDFHGTAAFSEPETRAIKWFLDQHPDLGWFMDLHSAAGVVLYPWGDDSNQSVDPGNSFANTSADSIRGIVPDTANATYQSYMLRADADVYALIGSNMVNRMADSTGTVYAVTQSVHLYPTSGSSVDYVYARHLRDPTKGKVFGFGIEFGQGNEDNPDCIFYPTVSRHNSNIVEVAVGLMEMLLGATQYS